MIFQDGFVDLEKGRMPPVMFLAGCSDNHFTEEKRLINLSQTYFPAQKIVFYDLGLSASNIKEVKSWCNVEYRRFPFEQYPKHVQALSEYRWKPLIIAVSYETWAWLINIGAFSRLVVSTKRLRGIQHRKVDNNDRSQKRCTNRIRDR